MRKVTLKLSVAIAAFLIGIAGTAFYFIYPTISFKAEGGGTPTAQNDTGKNDELIKIVVIGRVVDNVGRPMRGVRVQASLGLDLEGAAVETDNDGRFRAEAASPYWGKGVPNFSVRAAGYGEELFYPDRKDWNSGERQFEQTIILKPNAVNLEENRSLWREKRITDYALTVSFDKSGDYREPQSVLVRVRDGQAVSTELLDEKYKSVPFEEAIREYRQIDTVEKIFDYIQKALNEKAEVSVRYDKNFGYPRESSSVYINKGSGQYEFITIWKLETLINE